MKIKHYATEWSSKLKLPFTEKEKKFFKFLELSEEFEKNILKIRKKYNIPPCGFSYDREHEIGLGIPKYLEHDKWDEYLEDESVIADAFGFVGTWGLSLSYFIKYNYMPKFAEKVEPRAAIFDGDITLQNLQADYPALRKRKFAIVINQSLSKKQLKDLINRQWIQIKNCMNKLPTWNEKKHTNLELYEEIKKHKKKNITWDEIATILWKKYPENEKVLDESYIRTIYRRYTTRVSNLSKLPVSLT